MLTMEVVLLIMKIWHANSDKARSHVTGKLIAYTETKDLF